MSKYSVKAYQKIKNRIYTSEMSNKERQCVDCKEIKLCSDFHKKPALIDGFDKKCKDCRFKMTEKYEHSDKCIKSRKEYYYIKNYNLTYVDIEKLRRERNCKCEICNISESSLKRGLHIDHDHATGAFRGLLCDNCNKSLGLLKDSIEVLNKAIEYLKRTTNVNKA